MGKNKKWYGLLLGSVAASAMTLPAPVYAQDADTAEDDAVFEEIYVTARKKRELVVEVPMNIAVVGSAEISKRNLVDKQDVYRTIAGAANPRGELILRGLAGSNDSTPGTTTTFLNGIPTDDFGPSIQLFDDLFDVERIEVLRGPQGTLWGSNAIGGTVQVITTRPNLEEVEGLATVMVRKEENRPGTGNYLAAAVNIPIITDELALRVSGSFDTEGRKILNTATGNIGKAENHMIRSQLLWQPSADLRVNLTHINQRSFRSGYTDLDLNTPSFRYEAVLTANPDAAYGYDVALDFPDCPSNVSRTVCNGGQVDDHHEKFTRYNLMDPYNRDTMNLFILNVDKDDIFPGADFSYAGSYRRHDNRGRQAWWSRADAQDMFKTWIIDTDETKRWTHEARLASNSEDSAFDWTVGMFYDEQSRLPNPDFQWQYHASDNKSRAIAAYLWGSYWGYADPTELGQTLYGDGKKNYNIDLKEWTEKELALFGELSYTFDMGDAGSLEVTGGIRYYDLHDKILQHDNGLWVDPIDLTTLVTETDDGETGTRKKLSVNYMPNDEIGIFAIYSEGYRRGGNNGATPPVSCRNDPAVGAYVDRYLSDKIKNYEAGVKGMAFNRRMSFSSAIYQIDWTGVQANVYMDTCGFSYTSNAGKARTKGIEFESTTRLTDSLDLIVNAAYTNSKMLSDVPRIGASAGDDMTMVPDYNFFMALDQAFDLYDRDASVRLELAGYGDYKSHFAVRDEDVSPAYEVINLSGSVQLTETAKISLHINNLLDKDIILYKNARSRGSSSRQPLWYNYDRERNVAVRLDLSF